MTGERRTYYRSLDHLTGAPAVHASAAVEFPGFTNIFESRGQAELHDDADAQVADHSRRQFLALSAATLGIAAAAGCRRPEMNILPFAAIPDEQIGHIVHGQPTFYATSLARAGGALPVLVESHEGRPTKIEGHPLHPCSLGSTDAFAQATIFDLYSPDRLMSDRYPGVMQGRTARRWEDFDRFAREHATTLVKQKGKGLSILTEQAPSPALRVLREAMMTRLPQTRWHSYEAVDTSAVLEGAKMAFGEPLVVRYRFDRAERILALDSDFLGIEADRVFYSRSFAAKRKDETHMNRLYVVEPTYTITGTMADHRLRLAASQIGNYLITLAQRIQIAHADKLKKGHPAGGTALESVAPQWVNAVAADLAAHAGKCLIVVGPRQPAWVHALAHAVNDALGNYDAGMAEFRNPPQEQLDPGLKELCDDIAAGKVNTLVIVGGNPVLNAPADLKFGELLAKVPHTIRLGLYHDHTSARCAWHLPLAHPLEGWGDTEASDGSLCCVQPLLAPLNSDKTPGEDMVPPARGGRTILEVLSLLTQTGPDGKPVATYLGPQGAQQAAYRFVQKSFSLRSGIAISDANFATTFNRYKQLGFFPIDTEQAKKLGFDKPDTTARTPKPVTLMPKSFVPDRRPEPTRDAIEVIFHPSYTVYDGRGAMNPWLQELPDPITKVVWDNAACLSPRTAGEFHVKQGDLLSISINGTTIDVPAFVLPGQADFTVALAFGQFGEMPMMHVPQGGGVNVFPLRTSQALHIATGATLTNSGRKFDLVTTQEHGIIPEGRDLIREVAYNSHTSTNKNRPGQPHAHNPAIGIGPDGHISPDQLKQQFQGGYGNAPPPPMPTPDKQKRFPLDLARPAILDSPFQWAMVIDLAVCTGCSACMIACAAENNIPVVGKHEVKRNREMHWIRLDRYFTGPIDEPNIVSQPVACVQCESAPCEQVCPVNAAVHSPEGLNLQVYNRCIGTRYCSNACPYKVRRFNWFDFNKRRQDELRVPTPWARAGMSFHDTGVPETLKMQKNPDVSVRMRGVMEKCTYCVQRIERGKYGAKIAATLVATGRRTIDRDPAFSPIDGSTSAYQKPKNPSAAGYDLDALGRVIVPDGVVIPACAAACPSRAITFGNVLDANSQVAKLKQQPNEYLLLGELNTKPRTSYLPRVRNWNADMK